MDKRTYRITERNKEQFLAFLERCDFSVPKKVTIERWRRRHSDSQRGYYWGVVLAEIGRETGNDKEDLHQAFKQMFLAPEEKHILGTTVQVYSTRNLTTVEYSEFVERVCAYAATQLGIAISEPAA